MQFVLTHIPHILPALVGVVFMGRFGLYAMRLPPSHLSDEELEVWHAEQAKRRKPPTEVVRRVARLGTAALPLLLVAFGTGLAIYTVDLSGHRPSEAMRMIHAGSALVGLALVAVKLAALPEGRLRQGLRPARMHAEGSSLAMAVSGGLLVVSGLALLVSPSSSSGTATVHLIVSVIWMLLFQWHLYRYLSRAVRSALREPAPTVVEHTA
jgi:hypothetical protein